MSIKPTVLLIWLVSSQFLMSCTGANESALEKRLAELQQEKTFTLTIAPYKQPCMGMVPMMCLTGVDERGQHHIFFEDIRSFKFKEGVEAKIRVVRKPQPEPVPADASSVVYELVAVLHKKSTNQPKPQRPQVPH